MEIIIYILIGIFVFWALFIREINPSNKTDEQLWKMLRISRPGSKESNLIMAEMEKRGLMGSNSTSSLSPSDQKALDEANKIFEESGMKDQIQELFASDIPNQLIAKSVEIAQAKNISEKEASKHISALFDEISQKYKNNGFSQNEADDKALQDILSLDAKNA